MAQAKWLQYGRRIFGRNVGCDGGPLDLSAVPLHFQVLIVPINLKCLIPFL